MLFPRHHTITLDAALRDLVSDDPRVRASAADSLGDVEGEVDRARAGAALIQALDDPRVEVVCNAALALGALADKTAVDVLLRKLESDSAEVRQTATIALGRIADTRAFEPLARALTDGPPDVRYQAALSLIEVDPSRAFDPLARAVADEDAEVRGSVATALGILGDPRAAGWLAELVGDARAETRFEAACALARLGDARAVEPLLPFLERDDCAFAAIEALEWTGDRRSAARLAHVMHRIFAARVVRVRAAAALLAVAPDHGDAAWAHDYLKKAARARREDVRGLAEEALARLGGEGSESPR